MLDGFDHAAGEHCGSTSLHDVATFRRWNLSEPVCFGVGSGLGFSFIESDDSPRKQFVGRTPWLETAFHEHLGIATEERRGQSFEDAWADVTAHVDAGRPVLLFVDIFYLEYYDSDVHFSPHVVVAVDYDDDAVVLADSEFDDLQRLPLDQFGDAFDSDWGFYGPTRNHWLVALDDPTRSVAEAARDGIELTARAMLSPDAVDGWGEAATNGLDGVRAFGRSLPSWPDLPDATWCTRFAYQNVEKRGTGGGAFRGLFAPFLDAMVDELDAVTADHVAEAYAVADDWSAVGQSLKRAGLAGDESARQAAYDAASEQVFAVADREERLYESLLDRL
ncbi:BtrH N-terminal domain-containing protein [Haloarchaeobius sp. HRN-SO-5]|uniref:BtrH N-terminal domain-containing protein n=1 Tax=Haloarchaeobius sp. HRN-SO-5 TaxID=3446118 RepID=UPI003EB6C8FF